ncbi:hypothetical protein GQR58_013625 [Nymphon striatum]|nr:hypothetical protein GQR58_013625 [Nymphon striatum]
MHAIKSRLCDTRIYVSVLYFTPLLFPHTTPLYCNLPNGITGVCTSAITCQNAKSEVVGICGNTQLACCKAQRTCGSTISMTNSHFVHPHFPATVNDQARCQVTVLRPLASMCQVKVDFIDFMLRQPTNGRCSPDSATFSGTPTPVPQLCGNMTGQHLYLDFENDNTPIVLNIRGDGKIARSWNIRFSYVSCLNKAPKGCLQYYTEPSGSICSLNYKGFVGQTHDEEYVPVRVNKNRILANLSYSTCIRPIRGNICGIRYTVNGDFHVSDLQGAGSGPDCSSGNQVIIPSGQESIGNRVANAGPFNSAFCGRNMNPKGSDAAENSVVY